MTSDTLSLARNCLCADQPAKSRSMLRLVNAPLDGKRLGQLAVSISSPAVTWNRQRTVFRPLHARVEQRQHLAAGIHGRMQMRDHRRHQRFGQVVERRPQKHHIKAAIGKPERLRQKAIHIPYRLAVLIRACLPVSGPGIVNQIGLVDAMAQPVMY